MNTTTEKQEERTWHQEVNGYYIRMKLNPEDDHVQVPFCCTLKKLDIASEGGAFFYMRRKGLLGGPHTIIEKIRSPNKLDADTLEDFLNSLYILDIATKDNIYSYIDARIASMRSDEVIAKMAAGVRWI